MLCKQQCIANNISITINDSAGHIDFKVGENFIC